MANTGDAVARDVVTSVVLCVCAAIAQLISVLDPHAVVVGGGLGCAAGLYWQTLQESIRQHIYSDAHRQLAIVQSEYGNLAAVVGAAATVLQNDVAGGVSE